jgi:hypothetical protein
LTGAAYGIVKLIGWLAMMGAAAGLLMGFTTRCAAYVDIDLANICLVLRVERAAEKHHSGSSCAGSPSACPTSKLFKEVG